MPKPACCPCQWTGCHDTFESIEILYDHLCNEHIGRRATHNLCLECRWNDCGAQAAKRDHLASHLLVHIPFKPHQCSTCKKAFKRPQDLKKHEKIHTMEHKASLISKQPGYRAVRRKRQPPRSSNSDWNSSTQATSPESNKAATDYSGGSSSSSSYMALMHKQSPVSMDPVQDLFQQVVDPTPLSPEYNDDMMGRLDCISAAIQQQPTEWIPPVSNPSDLDALQGWLEQLSANIQTDDASLYPDLAGFPQQQQQQPASSTLSASGGDDMYLYSNELATPASPPDWKTLMMTTAENPLAVSVLLQNSSHSQPPPSVASRTSSSPSPHDTQPPAAALGASFWTPACDLEPLDRDANDPAVDGPTPSESVDFSAPVMVHSERQPVHLFESSCDSSSSTSQRQPPPLSKRPPITHEDKRNMMHMLNVLASPGCDDCNQPASASSTSSSGRNDPTTAAADLTDDSVEDPPKQTSRAGAGKPSSIPAASLAASGEDDTEQSSPYAGLIERLRELSCNGDDGDDGDDLQQQQQRHAEAVNYLWDAVMRAKRSKTKASRSSDVRHPAGDDTRHSSNPHTPLISV